MNKLIEELKERIEIERNHIRQEQKGVISILKEYLAFAQKVEKEIDRARLFQGRIHKLSELKERIFNGTNK